MNSQQYNALKYGEFCSEKATELLRIVAKTSQLMPSTRLQYIQRIVRLIHRHLTPSFAQVKEWNALMISSPYCVDNYGQLLPILLQKMTLDVDSIREFLKSWEQDFTPAQQRDFLMIVLAFCLKKQNSPNKYIVVLTSVQQMATHYPWMLSHLFLDRAAQLFVSYYDKKTGFVFDSNTIASLQNHRNSQVVALWLKALLKAFDQKGFSVEAHLLKQHLEQKQQGTYTYKCESGDTLKCTGQKSECDREWKANCPKPKSNSNKRSHHSGFNFGFEDFFKNFNFGGGFRNSGSENTRPNINAQKLPESGKLKSVSEDLQAYKKQRDSNDLKNKAGISLFEYYTKLGKSASDVQGKDAGEQLWPHVSGILDKATFKKLWHDWSRKNHPDKSKRKDADIISKTGSAIHDCLVQKLDDKHSLCS
jgi:hypothetical protein